jgi:hypothetical protein
MSRLVLLILVVLLAIDAIAYDGDHAQAAWAAVAGLLDRVGFDAGPVVSPDTAPAPTPTAPAPADGG